VIFYPPSSHIMDQYIPHSVHHSRDNSSSSSSSPVWPIILGVCLSVTLAVSLVIAFYILSRRRLKLHHRVSRCAASSQDETPENGRIPKFLHGKLLSSTCSEASTKIPYNDVELSAGVEPLRIMHLEFEQPRIEPLMAHGLGDNEFSTAATALPSPRLDNQKRISSDTRAGCLNAKQTKDFRSIINMLKGMLSTFQRLYPNPNLCACFRWITF
jgi:hypothetical protein